MDKKGKSTSDKKGNRNTKGKQEGKESKYGGQVSSKYNPAGIAKRKRPKGGTPLPKFEEKIRLNKFISHAGICSRREADTYIKAGLVSVNGEKITELGKKIYPTDTVKFDGAAVQQATKRYILVNKPQDTDPYRVDNPSKYKKSVYHLILKNCKEEVIPVGKLRKKACGLVLYTNDTDLEKKLTHPKFKVSQLFHIVLNKEISKEDLNKMEKGMYVDHKMFSVEEANQVKGSPNNEIGVQILSPKNNIIEKMLDVLGYEILKLDRVEFAGLTKLDLPRGRSRNLKEKEVAFLMMA